MRSPQSNRFRNLPDVDKRKIVHAIITKKSNVTLSNGEKYEVKISKNK